MPKFVSLLIDRAHERYLGFALWSATLILVLLAGGALCTEFVAHTMRTEAERLLEPRARLQHNIVTTQAAMAAQLVDEPCSPEFHTALRDIAFLPDGLNEFLYVPNGVVKCSVSSNLRPFDLGVPDARDDRTGAAIWYDRPLGFLGRHAAQGTIIAIDDFGLVVPAQPAETPMRDWVQFEAVDRAGASAFHHRDGQAGLYAAGGTLGILGSYLPLHDGAFFATSCLPDGEACVTTRVALADFVAAHLQVLLLGVLVCGMLALGISGQLHNLLRRFWSFEARFLRNFNARNIICTYQPVLSLVTGNIHGCEVLVRWRDVDGSIVYPDQFLPIVEARGLGRQLTRFVVSRAYEELSSSVPVQIRLQVNFNIFPSDLDAAWIRDTFKMFEASECRFDAVVEIVETDQLEIEHARREIEALRRHGIKTHLDDFGTGYSNIENLARLPVDGVKLDRSFAMAADGSLMFRMLGNAIEMIHAAGHKVTVEGVETEARLAMIKATGQVELVQGYLISRPVEIARFVQLLVTPARAEQRRPYLIA